MMKEIEWGIGTRGTDGNLKRPAASVFRDLFPPPFHSAANDVGFAKGNILGAEKKAGHISSETSDPPNG
jgi:hypothetical protein